MNKELENVLKKESINESDLAILSKNIKYLSHNDLVRFGFKQGEVVDEPKAKAKRVKKS